MNLFLLFFFLQYGYHITKECWCAILVSIDFTFTLHHNEIITTFKHLLLYTGLWIISHFSAYEHEIPFLWLWNNSVLPDLKNVCVWCTLIIGEQPLCVLRNGQAKRKWHLWQWSLNVIDRINYLQACSRHLIYIVALAYSPGPGMINRRLERGNYPG